MQHALGTTHCCPSIGHCAPTPLKPKSPQLGIPPPVPEELDDATVVVTELVVTAVADE